MYNFENVKELKYLGTFITADNNITRTSNHEYQAQADAIMPYRICLNPIGNQKIENICVSHNFNTNSNIWMRNLDSYRIGRKNAQLFRKERFVDHSETITYLLSRPSRSPDICPIEHVWDLISRSLIIF